MTEIQRIRKAILAAGGLKSFSSYIRKTKNSSRPSRFNLKESLQDLTDEELNVSFKMGLIGNNRTKGTLVSNSTRYPNSNSKKK